MNNKVLLGMSGGVDSSVAAMILQEKGFEVIGITFLFSGNSAIEHHPISIKAKRLAQELGINHYTIDLRNDFKDLIISYFVDSYKHGNTPFPCAVCNPQVKFHNLKKYADKYSCDYISTGHYVNIVENNGVKYISTGKNNEKDQSFFLWGLSKNMIQRLMFPLGNMFKDDVRKYAENKGFKCISGQNESMGICFIEGSDYRKYLAEFGLKSEPGYFINKKGEVLGKHKGIFHYTIGQRRGLGIHLNKPVFVQELRPKTNEVVLADFGELYRSVLYLQNTHFVNVAALSIEKIYTVKIRYRLQETPCRIRILPQEKAVVELQEPVAMVANGQTAVIYDEDRLIGGGFISGSD
ncbi:MAG: tRNA 2-thiouridine(34) synthase MnmA [Bacteroidota bacterium]